MAAGTVNRFRRKWPYWQFMETRRHIGRDEATRNAIRDFKGKLTSYFDHIEKTALKIFTQKMDLLLPLPGRYLFYHVE